MVQEDRIENNLTSAIKNWSSCCCELKQTICLGEISVHRDLHIKPYYLIHFETLPADFNGLLWCRCNPVPGAPTSVAPVATASSVSCDLRDSKHKRVRGIMRLIRLSVVKRWVITTRETKCVWKAKQSCNAEHKCERGCGQEEQFVCTADCNVFLRQSGARLVTGLRVNCFSIVPVCVHHLLLHVTVCKELVPVEPWGYTVEAD